MTQARAFLSYTRIDDQYFGGNITALRKRLELGVQVVAGDKTFEIFQDIDGIELGQQWDKQISDALKSAKLLIPILTPCFFGSSPCRDEFVKFLAHEKAIGRDDLIIPIYFITVPSLEKSDLRNTDLIAVELSKRQRFDWRELSELPIDDLSVKKAAREVAQSIALAYQRRSDVIMQAREAAIAERLGNKQLDEQLTKASQQVTGLQGVPTKQKRRSILWVDDNPDNNFYEREALRRYGIDFELATSTETAKIILSNRRFDVIISDMSRPPDPRAGYTLLEAIRTNGHYTPYYIYSGSRSLEHTAEAKRRGAQGATNTPDELVNMVLNAIGGPDIQSMPSA